MGVKDLFSHRTETTEDHHNEQLRTRYYKTTKQKAMTTLKQFVEEEPRFKLLSVSEEHGEIMVQVVKPRKAFMVISVIMVYPYRTAIDLTITTETTIIPIDFGYSRKEVLHIYERLNKLFEFAGVGLSR